MKQYFMLGLLCGMLFTLIVLNTSYNTRWVESNKCTQVKIK